MYVSLWKQRKYLSDARCVIHDVVSLLRGYKRMARIFLCRDTLSWRLSIGMQGKPHQCKQRKQSDSLNFIHLYYVSRIHGHINFQWQIFTISGNSWQQWMLKLNLERTRGAISFTDSYSHHPISLTGHNYEQFRW